MCFSVAETALLHLVRIGQTSVSRGEGGDSAARDSLHGPAAGGPRPNNDGATKQNKRRRRQVAQIVHAGADPAVPARTKKKIKHTPVATARKMPVVEYIHVT